MIVRWYQPPLGDCVVHLNEGQKSDEDGNSSNICWKLSECDNVARYSFVSSAGKIAKI